MKAGFLSMDALAIQAALLPEHEFRVYHLGQSVTGAARVVVAGGCVGRLPAGRSAAGRDRGRVGVGRDVVELGGVGRGDVRRCPVRRVGERSSATDDELEQVLAAGVGPVAGDGGGRRAPATSEPGRPVGADRW